MATLLQFSVGNFRSFNQVRTFSMAASSIQDEPKENVVANGHYKFLISAALYGANSSGKSNLVYAFSQMKEIVINSGRLNHNDQLPHDPFLLAEDCGNRPTHFETVYLDNNGNRIRYGFDYSLNKIEREWLFIANANQKERPHFVRDEEGIAINENLFSEGNGLEERTNDNRLFLSVVAQLGGKISMSVIDFFQFGLKIISGLDNQGYEGLTEKQFLDRQEEAAKAMAFFSDLQLGFDNLEAIAHGNVIDVYSIHNVYGVEGNIAGSRRFRFDKCESQGTQKLFELAGPLFDTLKHGRILVMDELDAKMHPLISQHIIRLFNDPSTNPKRAQLIFTTHDTNLLSSHLLRRDQIWFTEKDKSESSDLYSLMHIVLPDGSKPRGDGNIERNYIRGRYGAIPYLQNLE